MTNIVYNMDCMVGLREYPDKYFDLAVVDPPYGINKAFKATSRISAYGDVHVANDLKPGKEYFAELMRVSKNQIIWGYNHLSDMLPPTREFIFWYKHQPVDTYADGELAWTSFTKTAKCFDYPYFGGRAEETVCVYTRCKSRWHYTGGYIKSTPNQDTKFLIPMWVVAPAEGLPTRLDLILLDMKLTQYISAGRKTHIKNLRPNRAFLQEVDTE